MLIAEEFPDAPVQPVNIETTEGAALVQQHMVRSVPHMVKLDEHGVLVDSMVGFNPAEARRFLAS